jgi:hypothetical protein
MVGLDAEKKNNDLALAHKINHMGIIGPYTTLKDQYSQLKSLIKNGRSNN